MMAKSVLAADELPLSISISCLRLVANDHCDEGVALYRELAIEENTSSVVIDESEASNHQSTYNASVGDIIVSHLTGTPSFLFLCISHMKTAKCDVFIHGSNIIYVNINQHLKFLDELITVITAISTTVEEEENEDGAEDGDSFDKLLRNASKAVVERFAAAGLNVEEVVTIDEIAFAGSEPTLPLDLVFSKEITFDQIISRSIFDPKNHEEGLVDLFDSRSADTFRLLGVILLVLYANRKCDVDGDDVRKDDEYDYHELEAESMARIKLLSPYQPHFTTDSCSRMVTFKKPVQVKVEDLDEDNKGHHNDANLADEMRTAADVPPTKKSKKALQQAKKISIDYNIGKPGKRERSKPKHYSQEQEVIQAPKRRTTKPVVVVERQKTTNNNIERKSTNRTKNSASPTTAPFQYDYDNTCYEKEVYNPSVGQSSYVCSPPAKVVAPAPMRISYVDKHSSSLLERMNELEASLKVANNTIELTQGFEVKAATIKAEVIGMFREATEMVSDSTRLGASLATKHSTRMGEAIAGIVEAVSKPSNSVVSLLSPGAANYTPLQQSIQQQQPATIPDFLQQPHPNLQQVPPLSSQRQPLYQLPILQQQWSPLLPPTSPPPFMQQQYNYYNYQHSHQQQHLYQHQQLMMQQGFNNFGGYPNNFIPPPQMPGTNMPPTTPYNNMSMMFPPTANGPQYPPHHW